MSEFLLICLCSLSWSFIFAVDDPLSCIFQLESKHLTVNDDGNEGEDDVQTGCVGFRVYWEYFSAGFGPALMTVLLPLWIAGPVGFIFYKNNLL